LEASGCESILDLWDSLVVRLDKGKGQTQGELAHRPATKQRVNVNNNISHSKIEPESKLKLFIDIFHALTGEHREDVRKEILLHELVNTGHFNEEDVLMYLEKAQKNGQIFERTTGMYAEF
jgi:hypothetical protein